MKGVLVSCVFMCVALSFVQSASFYYRNGRELEVVQVPNEVIPNEIVSELRKDAEAIAIESEPAVETIVKEEILVPVETLRIADPVAAVPEPESVVVSEQEVIVPVNELRAIEPVSVSEDVAAVKPVVLVEEKVAAEANPVAPIAALKSVDAPLETFLAAAKPAVVAVVETAVPAANEPAPEIKSLPEAEAAVNLKELPVADPAAEKKADPAAEKEAEKVEPESINVKAIPAVEEAAKESEVAPASEKAAEKSEPESELKQAAAPTLIQQAQDTITNLVNNNPIVNAVNAITGANRDDPASDAAAAPAAAEPAASGTTAAPASATTARPTRPTLIQQFQHGVQNFQHQIQTVFNPNAAAAAASTEQPPRPPGIIQQFQQAVGSVFNRPGAAASGTPPASPIQEFIQTAQQNLQTAQQNFQGIFRPQSEGADPAVVAAPADPVGEKVTDDEPIPIVNETIAVVDDKVGADDAKKVTE